MDSENENPDHMIEFLLSDLSDTPPDRKELMHLVYEQLTQVMDMEKDIVGCDFVPFGRAPKKVVLQCKTEQVKDTLLIQGIDLLGCHVNLREPMDSPLRVTILGAPTYVKNVLIRGWLSKYGNIVDFQNEHFYYKGKRTPWRVNTRVALMKNVSAENKIPPWGKVKYRNKDVEFWTRFDGQDDMKCFSCGECVPKTGHECSGRGAKKKACYNCGGTDHLKYTCKYKDKVCHKCKQPGHTMRNCRAPQVTEVTQDDFPPLSASTPKVNGARTGESDEVSKPANSSGTNKSSNSFQVQVDVHRETNTIEANPEETDENEGEWELDRTAKRRRMNNRRQSSNTPSSEEMTASVRTRKASIVSNCSEAWEIIDVVGEEEVRETKKGPTKDPEINDVLLNKYFQQKMEVRHDQEDHDEKDETEAEAVGIKQDDAEAAMETEAEVKEDKAAADEIQEVSSPSILDDLEGHTFELDVASIGSSNMRDVEMSGDQDLKINFRNHVARGMRIREAHEKLDDFEVEDKKEMPMFVVNVGAADFKHGEETDLIELGIEYVELVEDIRYQCPDASIIVSSILPRSGKGGIEEKVCEETNASILSFNNELRKHCDTEDNVFFVDNYRFVLDEKCDVLKELYEDDIHLNRNGKKELSLSLFKVIKQVHFGSKLRKELLEASL